MLADLDQSFLIRAVNTDGDNLAANEQETVYQHVVDKALFTGCMAAPLPLFHASMGGTKITDLHIRHLKKLAMILRKL